MVMTEAYATSVVALAPVLILAGLIEAALFARRVRDAWQEYRDAAVVPARGLTRASPVSEVAVAQRKTAEALEKLPVGVVAAGLLVVVWFALLACLCWTLFAALGWLAEADPGPDRQLARDLFAYLLASTVVLVGVPSVRAAFEVYRPIAVHLWLVCRLSWCRMRR
ncbi:hypothetical protein ABGB09_24885 [Streptomyces sp. B8F3]|uniref:hypothetical protein n=1 Tax=Streptomyces sp. B8F3 TaxID=3153573 RepID=UPI00325CE47B